MSELSCDNLFIGRNETHDLSLYHICDLNKYYNAFSTYLYSYHDFAICIVGRRTLRHVGRAERWRLALRQRHGQVGHAVGNEVGASGEHGRRAIRAAEHADHEPAARVLALLDVAHRVPHLDHLVRLQI